MERKLPVGALAPAAFFLAAGALELGFGLARGPLVSWRSWEALGRALFHFLLAAGLLRRVALCRSIAMVYCLAAVILHLSVLGLAWAHAPFRYPTQIVVQSLFEVPSCLLLYPFLRSPAAARVFDQPLIAARARAKAPSR